jgi:VanZ family protein
MKWAALVVICLFGILVWAADRGTLPHTVAQVSAFPGGDILGHFLIAAALTYFINKGFSCRTIGIKSKRFLLGSALILLIITLEEISQIFFTTRQFSFLDLGSDYFGIMLAGWVLDKERIMRTHPSKFLLQGFQWFKT